MTRFDTETAGPRSLAGLLQIGELGSWTAAELGPILEHQLDTPLDMDLGAPAAADGIDSDRAGESPPQRCTFRQLLLAPHPPLPLLQRVKQFAKVCRSQPDGPLPHEVATVLYLAAIAAARRHGDRRISTLDDDAWRHAVDWALAQSWLNADLRALLLETRP